jgi:hypothetical protein
VDSVVLIGQLVGTVVGAIVGAYVGGRWAESGRIDAVERALAKVVEQETAKAFGQEQGKQAAMIFNLQHLNTQMATLTTTQEQIKTRISNEALDRQWRMNQKRDLYWKLIEVTQRLSEHYGDVADARNEEEDKIASQKLDAALSELFRLSAFAKIFGNQDCWNALKEFSREAQQAAPPDNVTKQWAEEGVARYNALVGKLIVIARREFGEE